MIGQQNAKILAIISLYKTVYSLYQKTILFEDLNVNGHLKFSPEIDFYISQSLNIQYQAVTLSRGEWLNFVCAFFAEQVGQSMPRNSIRNIYCILDKNRQLLDN